MFVEKPERCRGCPLWEAPGPVWGKGPDGAQLVLLGEAPSHEELIRKEPFVGPAGRVLNLALAGAGIERRGCYVTNTVKCFTGRTPIGEEVEACAGRWLREELMRVAPTTVVALGGTAMSALVPQLKGVETWRGAILEIDL